MHLQANINQHVNKTFSFNYLPVATPVILSAKQKSYTARLDSRMNVLRCIAIISIVWGHCLYNMEGALFLSPTMKLIQIMMLQTGRLGTIIFFMISGYFLSDKIENFTCLTYLRHRLKTIILPWFTFLSALVLFQLFQIITNNPIEVSSFRKLCDVIIQLYKGCIFHAAFWFVPVALFSSIVLIALKSTVRNIWLGLPLSAITLFYCFNLYYGWGSVNHTRAFAAYLLFMWVGIQIKQHAELLSEILNSTKHSVLIALLILFFFAACTEGYYLKRLGCSDAFASIRFSNIMASIFLFLLILKSDRLNWLNHLNPQKTVFGVYLIHCLITTALLPYLDIVESRFIHNFSISVIVFTKCFNFTVVIVLSFLLVYYFRKFKIGTFLFPSQHKIYLRAA